jgi:hypothetical protein
MRESGNTPGDATSSPVEGEEAAEKVFAAEAAEAV